MQHQESMILKEVPIAAGWCGIARRWLTSRLAPGYGPGGAGAASLRGSGSELRRALQARRQPRRGRVRAAHVQAAAGLRQRAAAGGRLRARCRPLLPPCRGPSCAAVLRPTDRCATLLLALGGLGFPAKLAARRQGELVMLAYSDIGLLNTFIELWRHDSMQVPPDNAAEAGNGADLRSVGHPDQASIEAREASRGVAEWRTCVQRAAQLTSSFQTQILKPVPTLSLWT
eukprot:scaffold7799_cov363-Prasinococcus_capsulatus_cf.AAC.2